MFRKLFIIGYYTILLLYILTADSLSLSSFCISLSLSVSSQQGGNRRVTREEEGKEAERGKERRKVGTREGREKAGREKEKHGSREAGKEGRTESERKDG